MGTKAHVAHVFRADITEPQRFAHSQACAAHRSYDNTAIVVSLCVCRYVEKGHDKAGTKLKLVVRGKANDAEVVKMPFVPTHYYKG